MRKNLKEWAIENNKEYLIKEWDYERNLKELGLNIGDVTHGSGKEVFWICQNNHKWKASINNRSNGTGCPFCAGLRALEGFNDLETMHPEIAKEWDYEKNIDLKPSQVSSGSGKIVHWICQNKHRWSEKVNNRTSKSQIKCPYCSNRKVKAGFNDLETTHPELAKEWDNVKNELTPEEVTYKSSKKVNWKCKLGHEWQTTVQHRGKVNGTNCPHCKKIK